MGISIKTVREVKDILDRIAPSYREVDLSTAAPDGREVRGCATVWTLSHQDCCRLAAECAGLLNRELARVEGWHT